MGDDSRAEIAELRAEVAALRRGMAVGRAAWIASVGLALLLGADRPATVVQADRFELLGPDGEVAMSAAFGEDGPALTLDHRGRTARLTAAGLELPGLPATKAEERPTVEHSGLGETPDGLAQTWVDVGDLYVSSMEVRCDESAFRERAPFLNGRAVLRVPVDSSCIATFKGGIGYRKLMVRGGDELLCSAMHDQLVCRNLRRQ